jgi:hypothetical protein
VGHQAPTERLRLGVPALGFVELCKLLHRQGVEGLAGDYLLVERLRLAIAALRGIEPRQQEPDDVHVAMISTERRHGHRKGPLVQRLGLAVPPLAVVEVRQIGEGARRGRAPGPDLFLDRQSPLEGFLGLVSPPLRFVESRHALERVGDPPVVESGLLGLRECLAPLRFGRGRSLFSGRLVRRGHGGPPL